MRPPILISMGDPAGIGPEIVVRALLQRPELRGDAVICGDAGVMHRALALVAGEAADRHDMPALVVVGSIADAAAVPAGSLVLWQACGPVGEFPVRRVSATAGKAAAESVVAAAGEVLAGRGRGLVTAPVHKEALAAAGIEHPGHTELLQHLAARHAGVPVDRMPVRMMLSCPGLSVVLVSIHVALREAIELLTPVRLEETVRIAHAHFLRGGMARPRVAVAGLNPHAGEGGLFGREDIEVIAPVVRALQAEGMDVSGPHPPDTVFMRARQGAFDLVVAQYHDQGLIPVKLLGLDDGVNTTLGLPLVRTSPDHGTAFDIAWEGRASPASFLAAMEAARTFTSSGCP
ncbi:4-hydroxythreonine-4-phosphate dehydrogenase PdxA [uncultured Hydrogenophaga sp.]|uniref:4-hydroxythreonine-4-phosphate dehydrogenase PdxA n=1 Tax=uncultured Hydrogenophaga sp. TaxID=199683 RepID=UPI00265F30A1|nr:4-hydroxythreonine-4-phosphate dehydrogenase PdxA [uncultured Hydrogenophaga sp.]